MKRMLFSAAAVTLLAGTAFGQDVTAVAPGTEPVGVNNGNWIGTDADLWDQGVTDGANGLSNATSVPFGFRRTILYDFVVPSGQTWNIDGHRWEHLWNTLPPGSGTGFEIRFYSDAGGSPGSPIGSVVSSTSYSEVATGNTWFSRPEVTSTAGIPVQSLNAGTYWTDATVVGPENNFWMTAPLVNGTEVWVDYADFGGLQPGFNVFGVQYDVTGVIMGTTGGGGYSLTVTGSCPGTVNVAWSGAQPNRQQGIVFAANTGSFTIPGGPCAGTQLGLGSSQLRLVNTIGTGNGAGNINGNAGGGACGGFLQLVTVANPCETSNVDQLP